MINKLKYFSFGLVLFFGLACKSKKVILEEQPTKCLSFAKVKDYSNVEDCGYILELEDGSYLFPQSVKAEREDFRFGPDQNIRIDYTISNGTTSLCVEKGKAADITCLVLLPPRPADCFDSEAPTIDWMVQLIDILRPDAIYKYLKANEIEYLFDCPKEKALYDCKGNLKWQYFKAEPNKNPETTKRLGRMIYRAEQNMD
jgi:hypothetical protein